MICRVSLLVGLLVGIAWSAPRDCPGGRRPGVAAISFPRGGPELPVGPERRRGRSPGARAGRRDAVDRPRSRPRHGRERAGRVPEPLQRARECGAQPSRRAGDRDREARRGGPGTASPDARPVPGHGRCRIRPRASGRLGRPGREPSAPGEPGHRAPGSGPAHAAPPRPRRAARGAVRSWRPGRVPRAVSDARAHPPRAPGRARRGGPRAPRGGRRAGHPRAEAAERSGSCRSTTARPGGSTPPSWDWPPSRWSARWARASSGFSGCPSPTWSFS